MKYLLTFETGSYEDFSYRPIAIFDDIDRAKRWAALDSRTVINDLRWETYESPNNGLTAVTGTNSHGDADRWDIAELPENLEPGTRVY